MLKTKKSGEINWNSQGPASEVEWKNEKNLAAQMDVNVITQPQYTKWYDAVLPGCFKNKTVRWGDKGLLVQPGVLQSRNNIFCEEAEGTFYLFLFLRHRFFSK